MTALNEPRFRDSQSSIYDFMDECLVVCPQCAACARVVPLDRENSGLFAPHRMLCWQCGYTKDWHGQRIAFEYQYDSYFGLPLWLQTRVGDHILWAYNRRHLEFIEAFVCAGWRNNSLSSRLPDWIKVAKNRTSILKSIDKLKQRLNECDKAAR
jgi:hypothetical protein